MSLTKHNQPEETVVHVNIMFVETSVSVGLWVSCLHCVWTLIPEALAFCSWNTDSLLINSQFCTCSTLKHAGISLFINAYFHSSVWLCTIDENIGGEFSTVVKKQIEPTGWAWESLLQKHRHPWISKKSVEHLKDPDHMIRPGYYRLLL